MPNYTFESLSPYDLETLVRDLLQADLKVRLEQFTTGRDQGIDLRYAPSPDEDLIVQCKHYQGSSWSHLQRALRSELPKVRKLHPTRYIVATTSPMTPARKEWICNTFEPYCQSPSDVYGPEDLNNLLSLNPHIEKSHYKLWLTSVAVMERILHAEIYGDQEADVESLRRRVCRFVSNPSVERALNILNDHHFCLITGVPGIGKTTLAEMLIIDHLERNFECFRIWDDVGQARSVWHRGMPQLFYYDDFLGKTGLRRVPDKNEDERLVRFIEDVVQTRNARLILTSREYIFNQAQWVMEGLRAAPLELAQCVVSLADYTPRIRATILYNHLYYSGLPKAHIETLVMQRAYKGIVRHPNYSPRIIEAMTDVLNVRDIPPEEYPGAVLANLDNPRRLWEVAFDGHLTGPAQNTLLVMVTLPDKVGLDYAEQAFANFHRGRTSRYGQPGSPYDWKRALKELDGNFVVTDLLHGKLILKFHNPSVRDFVEARIIEEATDATELIEFSIVPSQLARLHEILSRGEGRGWLTRLCQRYVDVLDAPPIEQRVVRFTTGLGWMDDSESVLRRFVILSRLVQGAPGQRATTIMRAALQKLEGSLIRSVPDRSELSAFISVVRDGAAPGVSADEPIVSSAINRAFGDLEVPDMAVADFDALFDLIEKYPDIVNDDKVQEVTGVFEQYADIEVDAILTKYDPETAFSTFEDLEGTAERAGTKLSLSREDLEEQFQGWDDYQDDDSGFSRADPEPGSMGDREMDNLFDSLLP